MSNYNKNAQNKGGCISTNKQTIGSSKNIVKEQDPGILLQPITKSFKQSIINLVGDNCFSLIISIAADMSIGSVAGMHDAFKIQEFLKACSWTPKDITIITDDCQEGEYIFPTKENILTTMMQVVTFLDIVKVVIIKVQKNMKQKEPVLIDDDLKPFWKKNIPESKLLIIIDSCTAAWIFRLPYKLEYSNNGEVKVVDQEYQSVRSPQTEKMGPGSVIVLTSSEHNKPSYTMKSTPKANKKKSKKEPERLDPSKRTSPGPIGTLTWFWEKIIVQFDKYLNLKPVLVPHILKDKYYRVDFIFAFESLRFQMKLEGDLKRFSQVPQVLLSYNPENLAELTFSFLKIDPVGPDRTTQDLSSSHQQQKSHPINIQQQPGDEQSHSQYRQEQQTPSRPRTPPNYKSQ
ncbi:uncharacterized protein FOMMEDRAFT_30421 [Fomitiporia mediterranea MF3/22]|uniref:uncharacterized protein n=1 Tax=Fomitiporia mediterranea (strain MF3/22) TaxID=694068 RepID=UPI00044099A4|nr:uncharacterized protein FOMMEDRAFT_30421 [Fomitiporia mediterranea MF3/22]EJD00349.1 hypothetical protein FOMMEDRAFT_30421 [Fomitiporia mediterranea MF3/22]